MKFSKEETPFLNETSYMISSKFYVLEPNMANLPQYKDFAIDPYAWKQNYEVEPRTVRQLITEADALLMKSHTIGIIKRSHAQANVIFSNPRKKSLNFQSG